MSVEKYRILTPITCLILDDDDRCMAHLIPAGDVITVESEAEFRTSRRTVPSHSRGRGRDEQNERGFLPTRSEGRRKNFCQIRLEQYNFPHQCDEHAIC